LPNGTEGHDAFLEKPIAESELIATVRQVLNVKSSF
jgi:FixJ family two-component response regulator